MMVSFLGVSTGSVVSRGAVTVVEGTVAAVVGSVTGVVQAVRERSKNRERIREIVLFIGNLLAAGGLSYEYIVSENECQFLNEP